MTNSVGVYNSPNLNQFNVPHYQHTRVGKMIRPFGPNETFTDCCSVYRNLSIGVALNIKTTKPFGFSQIEDAFCRLQKHHLQLQSCMKRKDTLKSAGWSLNPFSWFKKPEVVPKCDFWQLDHPTLPLNWIYTKDIAGYLKVLEDEIQVTIPENKLLWRAIVVQTGQMEKEVTEATVILIFHPSITDARGSFFIFNDFLEHLSDVLDGNKGKMIKAEMHENFYDCVDADTSGSMTMGDKMKMVMFMINFMLQSGKSPYLMKNPVPTVPDFATRLGLMITLNESETILRQVQDKGISLVGIFTAAGLAATHELAKLNYGTLHKFKTGHEADLRRYCRDNDKKKGRLNGTMINYVDQAFETGGIKNTSEFWELATLAHATIIPKLEGEDNLKEVIMCFKYHESGNCYKWFNSFALNTAPRNEFAVSVHEIDNFIDDRSNVKVNGIAEMVSAYAMGSPFFHDVVVYKEKITYSLIWNGNYTTMEKAQEYGQATLKYLKMISGGK